MAAKLATELSREDIKVQEILRRLIRSAKDFTYRLENLEKLRAYDRARYKANPEPNKRRAHARRKANLAAVREYDRKRNAERRIRNAEYYRQKTVERRNKQRTPAWANAEKMREYFKVAKQYGLQVDHIIPLRGTYVSGLNVEANLQLLEPEANLTKLNKFDNEKYQEWRKNGEAEPFLP